MIPRLSILMPALDKRDWKPLAYHLEKQVSMAGGRAEFLVESDAGEATSGVKRQRLTDEARGDYLAFVDDDDWVSDDYVATLLEGCDTGADAVAFDLTFNVDGRPKGIWHFGMWGDNLRAGMMTVNHLCAWRRDLATLVAWCPDLGCGDDQLWYGPLHAAGVVKNCHRIDKVLYEYRYVSSVTQNQTSEAIRKAKRYWNMGLGVFLRGGEILVEVGGKDAGKGRRVTVRDKRNQVHSFRRNECEHLATLQRK